MEGLPGPWASVTMRKKAKLLRGSLNKMASRHVQSFINVHDPLTVERQIYIVTSLLQGASKKHVALMLGGSW